MTETDGKPPAHFVVIVPGYMGSRLRDRRTGELVWLDLKSLLLRDPLHLDRVITNLFETLTYPNDNIEPAGIMDQVVFAPPLFKQEHYNRLINALVSKGYRLDPPAEQVLADTPALYTFAYDWRQDNRISARQLGRAIDGWRARHPGAQPWIIAHSNGGLVARWYIEKEGGKQHVGRLFLMASPWDGAPKAAAVLNSGLEIAFLRLFNRFDIGRISRDAIRTFPSFYQLIPFKNPFLNDVHNEKVDLFQDLRWVENDRHAQLLLDGRQFNLELGNQLSVETLCFFGSRKPTTTFGRVRFAAAGRWAGIDWELSESGDGTVPERSAAHPNAAQKLPFVASHGDIYVNPAVLEKLDWEMERKYRLGVLAEAEVGDFRVQFEPEQDAYLSGEAIGVWVTIHEKGFDGLLTPIFGQTVRAVLKLQQALPGQMLDGSSEMISTDLLDSTVEAGRYEGHLLAPHLAGYYRLVCTLTLPGRPDPLQMEELVLVENELELHHSEPVQLAEPFEDLIPKGLFDLPASDEDEPMGDRVMRGIDFETFPAQDSSDPPFEPDFSFGNLVIAEDEALTFDLGEQPAASVGQDLPTAGLEALSFDLEDLSAAGVQPSVEDLPPPAEPSEEARFLNAVVLDHPAAQPVPLDKEFTLALWVDPVKSSTGGQMAFDGSRLFTQGVAQVTLSVVVTSSDFTVYTSEPQSLRVPKSGRSKNTARFDLQPLHEGPGQVMALFFMENNFVQGMLLTVNVAQPTDQPASPPAISHVEKLGRPLEGAFVMQPRDLSMIIKRHSEGGFTFTLVGPTVSEAILPISDGLLDRMISDTRKRMLEVVYLWEDAQGVHLLPPGSKVPPSIKLAYQSGLTISERVAGEGMRRMAEAGHLLYEALFYSSDAAPDAIAMGDKLRALLLSGQYQLQIVSKEFLLPWGLLYLSDGESFDPSTVDSERFVGFRHIVEHIPLQNVSQVTDAVIPSQPALDVSINFDAGIDAQFGVTAVASQLAFFRELAQANKLRLTERSTKQEFLAAWGDRANNDQILYFYGHAVSKNLSDPGGPAASSLQLSNNALMTLDELKLSASTRLKLRGAPLVFINACESAELSPLFYDGFMPYFVARGARGVIGTECQVPVRFGDEWARRFFKEFLRGERSLGRIFLQLRCDFLKEHRNILGLLYALYCDGDTRVSPGI